MNKLVVRLMSAGLLLGMSVIAPAAIAQDSGVANTAEDFKSVDGADGFLGSGTDIWQLFHQTQRLSGGGVADEGFYRSQSRRIDRQAESLRERQQAILEQRAAEGEAEASSPDTVEAP